MNNENNREIIEISLEDIIPNRFQPRLTFDVEALNELANSIKEHGIIQPLVVRRLQDKYEIIAGERRYKAAALIGMNKVPCIVMNLNDNESAEVAVIENIQRKEMTPLEEAKSFKKLLDKGYLTQDDLARRMGKSQSSVANKLRLLNLDEMVQDAILNGKISERHARSLLRIGSKEEQRKILSEIIEKRLTVRQTDDLIREKYGVEPINENFANNRQTQMSVPEVNIPVNNITGEVNPQLNLINNLGRIDENKVYEADKDTRIEPLPDERTNPALNIFRNEPVTVSQSKTNIDSIINPSVFSNPTPPPLPEEETNHESVMVDINQIKQNAESIKKEESPRIDISSLMQNEDPKDDNKFFTDLNISEIEEAKPNKSKALVEKINKNIDALRLEGNNIYKEELDLGNSYQITIRIDK